MPPPQCAPPSGMRISQRSPAGEKSKSTEPPASCSRPRSIRRERSPCSCAARPAGRRARSNRAHLAAVDAAIDAPADLDPAGAISTARLIRRVRRAYREDHARDERGSSLGGMTGSAVETPPRRHRRRCGPAAASSARYRAARRPATGFGQEIVGLEMARRRASKASLNSSIEPGAARRLRAIDCPSPMFPESDHQLVEEKLAALLRGLALVTSCEM